MAIPTIEQWMERMEEIYGAESTQATLLGLEDKHVERWRPWLLYIADRNADRNEPQWTQGTLHPLLDGE
ncbi:Hypothetical predicted protein [Pelobates cultripes]|uniref:Uncharacterized protein n=1 Tax=Pelobates cultripes TaxID=61616 RepID=A0AAD1WNI3_PELCU|nr:Hypothetical predicted protein [Pelobates cultripes]